MERIKDAWPVLAMLVAVAAFFAPLLLGRALVAEPDALTACLPARAFIARALAAAEWPLWNPDTALGKPILPDLVAGVLYPANLLLALPPLERGFNLLFVGHYLWTGIGAILALRACGLPRGAALLGAVAWTFGGTMVSLGNVVTQMLSAAWLPWVLYGWLRPHRLTVKIACASLATGFAFLAGGAEMVLVSAVALLVVSRHPAALLVPPLGAALAAVELLPFSLFLTETWRGTVGFDPEQAMRYSVPPADLVQLAWSTWQPSPERFMPQVYVGPIVLVLAAIGLAAPRRSRPFWIVMALGAALVVMGSYTPVYPFLYAHLPMSNLLRYPEKLFLGLHALLAGAAAFGSASLIALLSRHDRPRWVVAVAPGLLAVLCALLLLDLARANRDALFAPAPQVVLDPPPVARAILAHHAARGGAGTPRIFSNPQGRPIPRSLPAAVALDRNLPWGAASELYGLANVNAPSSLNLVKHERLQSLLAAVPQRTAVAALAALGTTYLTSWVAVEDAPHAHPLPVPGERIGVKLYALDAQPRAFVARRVRAARDGHEALERFVAGDGGDHAGLALVEEDSLPAAPRARAALADGASAVVPAGGARVLVDRPQTLEIEVETAAPALLVVNDTMLDGWRAWIDGAPAALVEVNGLVRGVWLPAAGAHRVTMRYATPGLAAGAVITLVALLVVALAVWRARRLPRSVRVPLAEPALARAGR